MSRVFLISWLTGLGSNQQHPASKAGDSTSWSTYDYMAESAGFEPAEGVTLHIFSKDAH